METLAMSEKERRRLELFSRVRDGKLTLVKASELLSLSYRQAKRSYGRYRSEGDGGTPTPVPQIGVCELVRNHVVCEVLPAAREPRLEDHGATAVTF